MTTAVRRVQVLRGFEARDADIGVVRSQGARHLVVDPELLQGATDDGYRVGYQAGFDSALEDAAAAIESRERRRSEELASVLDQLANTASFIESDHADIIAAMQHQVIALAIDIAETLIGHELATGSDVGRAALDRALQLAPKSGPVTAQLHADDYATLENSGEINGYADRGITITVGTELSPGDCIVDVEATRIDARIAPALQRVREVLYS